MRCSTVENRNKAFFMFRKETDSMTKGGNLEEDKKRAIRSTEMSFELKTQTISVQRNCGERTQFQWVARAREGSRKDCSAFLLGSPDPGREKFDRLKR